MKLPSFVLKFYAWLMTTFMPAKLMRDKRGITGLVIATIIALIVITFMIPLGIVITASIKTTIDGMSLTCVANTTANLVFTNAWQAYNLAAILSIVAAAGAIITIIVAAFSFRKVT